MNNLLEKFAASQSDKLLRASIWWFRIGSFFVAANVFVLVQEMVLTWFDAASAIAYLYLYVLIIDSMQRELRKRRRRP